MDTNRLGIIHRAFLARDLRRGEGQAAWGGRGLDHMDPINAGSFPPFTRIRTAWGGRGMLKCLP